jgi:hypothetical protein
MRVGHLIGALSHQDNCENHASGYGLPCLSAVSCSVFSHHHQLTITTVKGLLLGVPPQPTQAAKSTCAVLWLPISVSTSCIVISHNALTSPPSRGCHSPVLLVIYLMLYDTLMISLCRYYKCWLGRRHNSVTEICQLGLVSSCSYLEWIYDCCRCGRHCLCRDVQWA